MPPEKDLVIDPIPLQAERPAAHPVPARRSGLREAIGWLLLVAAVFATVFVATGPAPYAIEVPGSTENTLGAIEVSEGVEAPLIEIEGAPTYESDGTLTLVTVGVIGNPDRLPSWIDVLSAWFRPSVTAVPIETLYPEGSTSDDIAAESEWQMERSQRDAVAAALAQLDIPFTMAVEVSDVLDDGPADGILQAGDILVSVNGHPLTDTQRLRELLDAHGTSTPATIVVRRGGTELGVEVTPTTMPDDPDRPVLGILVLNGYDFPIDVDIRLEDVGGPSAGLMFALGIYDLLTPGPLPNGEEIAGTGTIDADGIVGPIGGIRQKMHAAARDGADWFLAPVANCPEARASIPEGLTVIPVLTLDDALDAVEAIAEGGSAAQGLPRCTA